MLPKTAPPVGKTPLGMAAHRPTSKAFMHSARCVPCSPVSEKNNAAAIYNRGCSFRSVIRQWRHSSIRSLAGSKHDDHISGGEQQDVALAVGANMVSSGRVQRSASTCWLPQVHVPDESAWDLHGCRVTGWETYSKL